ncbi:MAG: hypothetical protein JXR23_02345 [Pontiellaceae bacterium]|nr:hypothetical protein [Pontiellaceae bacterium]
MNKKKMSLVKYILLVLGVSTFSFLYTFQATGCSLPLIIFDLYVGPPVAVAHIIMDLDGMDCVGANAILLFCVFVINMVIFFPVLYLEKYRSKKVFMVIQTAVLLIYLIISLPVCGRLYL